MKLGEILRALEALETRLSLFYGALAERFAGEEETVAFFRQMGRDEVEHRDLVRYQRRLVARNPADFREVEFDPAGLEEVTARIDTLLETLSLVSLAQALAETLSLERDAAEQHYRTVMGPSNPDLARLVANLAAQDRAHLTRLHAFIARWRERTGRELPGVPPAPSD